MIKIENSLLKLVCSPSCKEEVISSLSHSFNYLLPKYGITSINRIASFIGQTAHETCRYIFFQELGGKRYFCKYDPNTSIGKVLGNQEFGDGYKFRGRGIIQITGLYNYKRYGEKLGIDLIENPEIASGFHVATELACEYWKDRNINRLCDEWDVEMVTRKINGGLRGLDDRKKLCQIIKDHLDANQG